MEEITRVCSQCGIEKPLIQFKKDKSRRLGYRHECVPCSRNFARGYYAKNRKTLLQRRRQRSDDRKEEIRQYFREYNIANAARNKERNNEKKYGLSKDKFISLLESQNGLCALCLDELKRPFIDHDHRCCGEKSSCGKCVRGLLCNRCNTGLGMLRDDVSILGRAIEYLSRKSPLGENEH